MKKSNIIFLIGALILLIIAIVFFYKADTYTINFYDETKIINTIHARRNRPLKEPDSPKRDGYMFIGWYDNGELWNFDNNITKNLNLVAGWGKIEMNEE